MSSDLNQGLKKINDIQENNKKMAEIIQRYKEMENKRKQ